MAGNWIAIDHELDEKPQVLGLIERTGEELGTIIGRLVLLWSLADRQTTDGALIHVGLKSLAHQCGGTPEFWQAVVDVGWLVVDGNGISIPRFKERFGESARKRMIDAKRAKLKRVESDSATFSRRNSDEPATNPRDVDDGLATLQPQPQPQPQQLKDPHRNPTNRGGAFSSFKLWKNAKREEFTDPKNVQRLYELALAAGVCTKDERFHVFRLVAHLSESAAGPNDNLPGLITSVLRDEKGKDPWRARGGVQHEKTAREWIRLLDCPPDLQRRTSNLMPEVDSNTERHRQKAALLAHQAARDSQSGRARPSV